MTAHLTVRSTLIDPTVRDAFDRWYGEDHLPQAAESFKPLRCWRTWSKLNPAIHYAFYEYSDQGKIDEMMSSETFANLVEDFSQTWDGKVVRDRDVTTTVQMLDSTL